MRTRAAARVLITGALLLVPASASAASDGTTCSYTQSDGSSPDAVVYPDTNGTTGGMSGSADSDAGVCVDSTTSVAGTSIDGGSVEAGASTTSLGDAYVVADGDNNNVDPTGQSDGYAGISTFESGTTGTCSGGGTGTNSGGCLSVNGTTVSGSPVVCGNDGGDTWSNTTQDGCSVSQPLPPPPRLYPCPATTVGSTTVSYYYTSASCPAGPFTPPPPPTLLSCSLTTVAGATLYYYTPTSSCPAGPITPPPPPTLYQCPFQVNNGKQINYLYTSSSCPFSRVQQCYYTVAGQRIPYYMADIFVYGACPPPPPT